MSNKPSEISDLSDVAQASVLIRELIPVDAGASVKARIQKTARVLDWRYGRVRDVWYGQARRIDAHEMDELKRARFQEARRAHAELTDFIVGMETVLAVADPDFHRDQIDALRASRGEATDGLGRMDRAGTEGNEG